MRIFWVLLFMVTGVYANPVVMLDPAGHAGDTGRMLGQSYERAETYKFAMALQEDLCKKYEVTVVLSRAPGEELLPLQVASFANRLGVDLFLRIQFYWEECETSNVFLYQLLFNPLVDPLGAACDPLSFVPLYQAHFGSFRVAQSYGSKVYEYLNQDVYQRYFNVHALRGLPLKSLIGITAPALVIEMGICREDKWKSLVGPIADSLKFLLGLRT
jgi:N-acetylmuramoyl-L-alanine amidase.